MISMRSSRPLASKPHDNTGEREQNPHYAHYNGLNSQRISRQKLAPRGEGCRNEVAGDTIFVARSLWPVPAGRATAKTESYCKLDTGDQERSRLEPRAISPRVGSR